MFFQLFYKKNPNLNKKMNLFFMSHIIFLNLKKIFMRPFRSAEGIANWLLRLSVTAFIIMFYIDIITHFHPSFFKTKEFYFSAILLIFGILLFIGGFAHKESLTVFSGFVLFIISAYKLVFTLISIIKNHDSIVNTELILFLFCTATSLYFFAKGNKRR